MLDFLYIQFLSGGSIHIPGELFTSDTHLHILVPNLPNSSRLHRSRILTSISRPSLNEHCFLIIVSLTTGTYYFLGYFVPISTKNPQSRDAQVTLSIPCPLTRLNSGSRLASTSSRDVV
jgi:hypothetical protein